MKIDSIDACNNISRVGNRVFRCVSGLKRLAVLLEYCKKSSRGILPEVSMDEFNYEQFMDELKENMCLYSFSF